LPDFSAERQRFGNLSRLTITWDHFIGLVGGAGNSATITLPDGLYVMFWVHPMHLWIGAERSKK
jgi:hypothetical protein